MARTKGGNYSQESIEFWAEDPRIKYQKNGKKTSAATKLWFLSASQVAVKERSDILPLHWTPAALGARFDVDARTSEKCATILQQNCLVGRHPDGRLVVVGVGKRHPGLKDWGVYYDTYSEVESAHSRVEESRVKKELAAEPLPDPPKEPQRNLNAVLVEKVKTTWRGRFPDSRQQSYAFYQKIMNQCRDRDIAPWWVFKYAAEHFSEDGQNNPIKYVQFVLTSDDRPWPDEPGTSFRKWEEDTLASGDKAQRRRSSKPTSIGDIPLGGHNANEPVQHEQ